MNGLIISTIFAMYYQMLNGKIKVSAIVAASENNVIGKDNTMPWHIPADLKRFKALTQGKPVVMGRKTFQSILSALGKPLPGRDNIIVTGNPDFSHDDVIVERSLEAAMDTAGKIAKKKNLEEFFVIGGSQIYKQTLDLCDCIYLTRIHKSYEGDAFFPYLDPAIWTEHQAVRFDGDPAYSFITFNRNTL